MHTTHGKTLNATKASSIRPFKCLVLATVSSLAMVTMAYAEEAPRDIGKGGGLEEITVVAQKRKESLQDVPIAVTALSAKMIQEAGYQNSLQLSERVPNLQIRTSYSASNPVIYIRGVGNGDYNGNAVGGVGTYFDDVYIQAASGQVMQMFDLQQIEVLRGPQGTLYGKNTTGGAINFIPAKPTDEFEARFAAKVGNYSRVDVEGMISGPITDKIDGRLSFTKKSRAGFAKNITYDQTGNISRSEDANNEDAIAGRAQLALKASDRFNLRLDVHAGRDQSKTHMHGFRGLTDINGNPLPEIQTITGGALGVGQGYNWGGWREPENNAQTGSINFVGPDDVKSLGIILNASYDFDAVTFKSITAYEESSRHAMEDADASPLQVTEVRWRTKNRQISQEFQLLSKDKSKLDWIVGVHAFHEKLTANNDWELFHDPVFNIPAFTDIGFYNLTVREVYEQQTTSYAAFGQATWHITDRLGVTAGGRYTYEKRTWNNQNWFGAASGEPFSAADPANVLFNLDLSNSWSKFTWKGQADYKVTNDVMVYAGVSTGFKSGGYNAGAQFDKSFVGPFNPEKLTAYEGGIKSTLFDKRVRANLAAYLYKFKDQQVLVYAGEGISYTANAATSTNKGVELDLTALVTDQFNLTGGFAYTDAKFDNFAPLPGVPGCGCGGNRLPASPKWNFNVTGDYTLPVGVNALDFQLSYNFSSKMYYDTSQKDSVSSLGNITNTNARINYTFGDGKYEAALWAHNLFNQVHVMDVYPLMAFGGYDEVIYNQPRMFGVEFSAHFN